MAGWLERMSRRARGHFNRALAGPQLLAFVPALTLGAYWYGGEGALVVAAITIPGAFAVAGAFGARQNEPRQTDRLTGLHLRDSLEAHLDRVLTRSGTFGFTTACLAVKIDDFGQVTERFGAASGEEVLKRVAERLQSTCRANDCVVRLHGASFAIGLSPVRRADLEAMIQLSGRLQDAVAEPVVHDGLTMNVTASVGFSLATRIEDKTGKGMIEAAECALQHADRNGPAGMRAYSPEMSNAVAQKTSLMADVARALEAGQIVPWFQPQISTDTGKITGFEALARWNHPQDGMIPPSGFLQAIDDAGLMDRLSEVMLYGSLQALRAWDRAGVKVPRVGVNFSSTELQDPKLVERIRWELDRFELTPERLTVEVLETVVASSDDDIVSRNLAALSELGCSIDLDDFGTGHASISNIRRFAVNRLKIDRSFVARLDQDPEQQRVVSAILTMAERLDIETLAEGVETPGVHALLSQLGCTHVQGFGLARPMPFEDTIAWIDAHGRKIASAQVDARGASG